MHKLIFSFLVVALIVSCQSKKENEAKTETFVIVGENWDVFDGTTVKIMVRDTVPSFFTPLAEAKIEGGKFILEGTIKVPQTASISVLENEEYLFSTDYMVIEPDSILANYDQKRDYATITGGKYNGIITANVCNSEEYINAVEAARKANFQLYTETDIDKINALQEVAQKLQNLRVAKFDSLYTSAKDPMVRLLALQNSSFMRLNQDISKAELKQLISQRRGDIEKLKNEIGMGEIPEITMLLDNINQVESFDEKSGVLVEGSKAIEFSAKSLEGKTYTLNEVLAKNDYTLVEFWASWCGPCRSEIPDMKEAYSTFNPKGFEILSFNMDHKEASWVKASKEEELPWINVGDLLASRSPVVNDFGVVGIPANFLVNKEGTIVATHLRGKELAEKLKELMK